MTSVGVKINNSVTRQSGLYYFKIQRKIYYLTSTLLFHADQTLIYAQIYILDTAEKLNVRRANNNRILLYMIGMIEKILDLWDTNSFILLFMWVVPDL